MPRLNYHHLMYFWTVAREGGVARACARLRLAQPTVSGQIKALENALDEKLFERQGHRGQGRHGQHAGRADGRPGPTTLFHR